MARENTSFKGFDFEKSVIDMEDQIQMLKDITRANGVVGISEEIKGLQRRCDELKRDVYQNLTPWQRVQIARHPRRPYALDYIERVFTDFTELHGDRNFADDKAIVGGLAYLNGDPVVVIGHQKGRTVQESMARNFGMPHPEGYRKALRLMRLASRFYMPVITFIDTAGAYPGIGAEERGQATAIAENLKEMALLPVPIICCVIGEGGSGGALAVGVGDRLLMLENAWYSVISPEGCASILYRDSTKAAEAAKALKLTSFDLKNLGIIDEIVEEPLGGAHRNVEAMSVTFKNTLIKNLQQLHGIPADKLLKKRYEKYRCIGHFQAEQKKQMKPPSRRNRVKAK